MRARVCVRVCVRVSSLCLCSVLFGRLLTAVVWCGVAWRGVARHPLFVAAGGRRSQYSITTVLAACAIFAAVFIGIYAYPRSPSLDLAVLHPSSAPFSALTKGVIHRSRYLSGREGGGEVPAGARPVGAEEGDRAAEGDGGGGEEGCVGYDLGRRVGG
eukprot:COSAG02_NODE_4531_length_5252_cov_2.871919_4_plen_158_part_00